VNNLLLKLLDLFIIVIILEIFSHHQKISKPKRENKRWKKLIECELINIYILFLRIISYVIASPQGYYFYVRKNDKKLLKFVVSFLVELKMFFLDSGRIIELLRNNSEKTNCFKALHQFILFFHVK